MRRQQMKTIEKKQHRYVFGTTPSYDALLKTLMLRFAESYIVGDRDEAEKALRMLAASLPREIQGRAKEIVRKYIQFKEELFMKLESKRPKFLADYDDVNEDLMERLYEAYSEIVALMDEYKLLVREYTPETVLITKR